jgi:hypothetical protein
MTTTQKINMDTVINTIETKNKVILQLHNKICLSKKYNIYFYQFVLRKSGININDIKEKIRNIIYDNKINNYLFFECPICNSQIKITRDKRNLYKHLNVKKHDKIILYNDIHDKLNINNMFK